MGAVHSSKNRWTLRSQGGGMNGDPVQVNAALVGPEECLDDFIRVAGSRWKQAAWDRVFWCAVQETFVQQLTPIGCNDNDGDDDEHKKQFIVRLNLA
ncbi:jg5296 [Pararge aegeria aegeria]|uniref:Jg5296 protein n=1 Tax=Pararge aegeria aegeria TaxID=348720 RepID=A0A8S4R9H5_9NEOP|nr:jg5296 [Pararge aegeria aegeria]